MLHELFFAMNGLECSFWKLQNVKEKLNSEMIESSSLNSCNFLGSQIFTLNTEMLLGDSSYFHPCEIGIIEEILQVSELYKELLLFIEKINTDKVDKNIGPDQLYGVYLSVFAQAISDETEDYRCTITRMESNYLESAKMTLCSVLLEVKPFYHIFATLNDLIYEVKKNKLRGCQILDFLYKKEYMLVGEVQNVLTRVKVKVQKVLAEQLVFWIYFGKLIDPHSEFFIRSRNRAKERARFSSYANEDDSTYIDAYLDVDMLPSFVPLSAAEKILFIGQSILHHDEIDLESEDDMERMVSGGDCDFELLSSSSTLDLLDAVERRRSVVSKNLYSLLLNGGLERALRMMKILFLLGRGELHRAFHDTLKQAKPNSSNITGLFHRARRSIGFEDHMMKKTRLTIEPDNSEAPLDVFCRVRIFVEFDGVLKRFFSETVVEKYNGILGFLLKLCRAQIQLQDLWKMQKLLTKQIDSKLLTACLTLRHHMNLLINNIQYYIQVDVLETQFSDLMNKVREMDDYQTLMIQHEAFLSCLSSQCFLAHPHISTGVNELLSVIASFCGLVSAGYGPDWAEKLAGMQKSFDASSKKFLWALNVLSQSRSGRFTSQLVMRIDFNKFYSRNANSSLVF